MTLLRGLLLSCSLQLSLISPKPSLSRVFDSNHLLVVRMKNPPCTGQSRQRTGKAGAYLLHTSQVDFGNTWAAHEADSGGYHSYQHSYHKNEEDCSNFQWLPAAQILRSVGNTFLQENERLRCKRTQTKLLRGSLRLIPRTRRVSTGRRLENRRKELFRSDSPQLHSWSRPKWA